MPGTAARARPRAFRATTTTASAANWRPWKPPWGRPGNWKAWWPAWISGPCEGLAAAPTRWPWLVCAAWTITPRMPSAAGGWALERVLATLHPDKQINGIARHPKVGKDGLSLRELEALSVKAGLPMVAGH